MAVTAGDRLAVICAFFLGNKDVHDWWSQASVRSALWLPLAGSLFASIVSASVGIFGSRSNKRFPMARGLARRCWRNGAGRAMDTRVDAETACVVDDPA